MIIETRLRRLEEKMDNGFQEIRQLLMGRNIVGNWVTQPIALAMLNVKKRRIQDLRIHYDKEGNRKGYIKWRKSKGNTIQYFKPDIEKYLNEITIQ